MDMHREARIRELAYRLWELDGCPENSGETYWHRAEADLARQEDQHDKMVEDTFPASDPPANTGITGPRKA